MSVLGISEEAVHILDGASKLAQSRQHAELDGIHLFYSLIKNSNAASSLSNLMGFVDQKELLSELEENLTNISEGESSYPEPTATYLQILKSAEQFASQTGDTHVKPEHLLNAILDQDDELAEWIALKTPVPAAQISLISTPTLDQLGRDLTQLARDGKLSPVIGREKEIQQLIEILLSRGKNSALLLGSAGTGKTAIVEGLAQEIADGNVPTKLISSRLFELNLGSLIAGTTYRGEFEQRLQSVLKELENNRHIILVIDEFHAIVGAGTTIHGGPDAVTILKPPLARGDITCIGITTRGDYVRHIEQDEALTRRFHPINVEEPSPEDTHKILENLAPLYEQHHNLKINDQTLDVIIRWADRYIPSRHFPDKAIDLLGKSCSRAESLAKEIVDEDLVAEIISEMVDVPVGDIDEESRSRLLDLEYRLEQHIIGQEDALQTVSQAVRLAYAGLRDPRRPKGVFLFVGPSGVGKTELARILAVELFESKDALIRFDMSEYSERINISRLIGSAPGYVGYDQPGQLTQSLRDHPHSIVLFDEIEKACKDVFDLFLQLFDEGRLTDSQGRLADGSNAIFIMTSNLGNIRRRKSSIGFVDSEKGSSTEFDMSQLVDYFRPEFLNRIDHIVEFRDLDLEDLAEISELELKKLEDRLQEQHIRLSYEASALDAIAVQASKMGSGARGIEDTVELVVATPISNDLIRDDSKQKDWVHLRAEHNQIFIEWI
jgi:ATP-dependent Clp protease ATP-binding subunit ClpC